MSHVIFKPSPDYACREYFTEEAEPIGTAEERGNGQVLIRLDEPADAIWAHEAFVPGWKTATAVMSAVAQAMEEQNG